MDHCLKSLTFEIFPVHFFLYQIKYSGFGNKLTRILFTVGNVDRDIGRYSGRHSGRHSGRYSVDSPTNTWTTALFMKSWIPWYRTKPGYFTSAPFLFLTGFWNIWTFPDVVWIDSVDPCCWFVTDKSSSKFCRSTLLICVWLSKFFNTKQFQYCWIAF